MLYFIWLPLLGLRPLLAGYFDYETLLITIVLNIFLILDFTLQLVKDNFSVRKIALFFVIGVLLVLFNKAALALLNIIMAVYLLRGMRVEKLIKIMASISFLLLLLFLSFFYFNINDNTVVVMLKGHAYNLGFGNTNTASAFFMTNLMVIALLLYNYKKIISFLLIPFFYWIYILTLGRTSFYAEMVFYLSIVLISIPVFRRFKLPYRILPLLLFSLLIFLTYLSNYYAELNLVFTTRFSIYNNILNLMTPLNYFVGIAIPEGMPMDSSFFALLFDGGIIYPIMFLLLYERYYRGDIRTGDFHYMPFVLFMLATGFSENTFSSFGFLSLLLYKIFYDAGFNKKSNA